MNYQLVHDKIIERARVRAKPNDYCERHHIQPRSMGGNNDADNLVWLTAREHYLVHWLLYKLHRSASMAFAWDRMTHGSKRLRRYISHTFAYAKKAQAAAMREAKLGKTYAEIGRDPASSRKGQKMTPEQRARIAAASRGRRMPDEGRQKLRLSKLGERNPQYGKSPSAETRAKLSAASAKSAKTRTTARLLAINGRSDNAWGWAKHPLCEVDAFAILARLAKGWTAEEAVFMPRLQPGKQVASKTEVIRDKYRAKLKELKKEQE